MKECILYRKLQKEKVRCLNCAHYCFISEGKRGICRVRENLRGKLYSLNYGKIAACNIDPIEKKPLFHFLPGSSTLSLASPGCNFKCASCQNWQISQVEEKIPGESLSPEKAVELAQEKNLPSISYTYTEPAIFSEYALESMKLAKKKGLKNAWVSNGFWSKELFDEVSDYIDAANIDLKSFKDSFYRKYCSARLNPVLENLKRIKKKRIWLEVTTLVIPELNDSEKNLKSIAGFIKKELGSETPWHVSAFSGEISWKLSGHSDTPLATIEKACRLGKKAGLKYVYGGNIPKTQNTQCPECGALAVGRTGYFIQRFDRNGKCSRCGAELDLVI